MADEDELLTFLKKRKPMMSMQQEFKYNEVLKQKIASLSERGYTHFRPVRGDGNCYYRAVGFGILYSTYCELSRVHGTKYHVELVAKIRGFDFPAGSVPERAREHLLRVLEKLGGGSGPVEEAELVRVFNEKEADAAWICVLRYAVSNYIRSHADLELNGLGIGILCDAMHGGLDTFCNNVVQKDGEDARDIVQAIFPTVWGRRCVVTCGAYFSHR